MKVVGTGSPTMLTVRLKASEVRLLRDVLCVRRARVLSETAGACEGVARGVRSVDHRRVEDGHDELFLITKLLDALRQTIAPGQPLELVGPTWLLDPVIRDAASEAAERLSQAVDRFRADRAELTAEALRAAVDTASASAATLIGLDHAQNHAVE